MSDLASSSAHRDKGLMSPNYRRLELRRILKELRTPDDLNEGKPLVPTRAEEDGAQDLCYRLYSEEAADLIAGRLGTTRQAVREALDAALKWTAPIEV